ncbi:DNA-binding IclR family transcriptional regulator [Microbacterium sp. AK009]|nr:DNA-binding IclR family transcriptional regulator [Microbacterium sp. AK009]
MRQHTQLGVLSGTDVLFIERLSTRDAVLNATLIGGRMPLHASSSGLVLLAFADPALVTEVVRQGLRVYTEHTLRTEKDLRARLRQVRADGFAVNDGHIHAESRGIAVPVSGPDGSVYAAVGFVVPNDGASPHPYIGLLRRAAAGIAKDLAEAYRADAEEHPLGIRSLVRGSERSLEYFEQLTSDPHDAGIVVRGE